MVTANSICINIQLDAPYITPNEYARRSGLTIRSVKHLISKGLLPIVPKNDGREITLINLIALAEQASNEQ